MYALAAKKSKKDPATPENSDNQGEDDSSADNSDRDDTSNNNHKEPTKPTSGLNLSARDLLLLKDIQELQDTLPVQCTLKWEDANVLHEFCVTIKPDEGLWVHGIFRFAVTVPSGYNMEAPKIKCNTKIWHPNISEDGAICLSILRQGWVPTRHLKDVIWGVNSLFTDLLNFEDPLNVEAAEQHKKNPEAFKKKVRDYIQQHCVPDTDTTPKSANCSFL